MDVLLLCKMTGEYILCPLQRSSWHLLSKAAIYTDSFPPERCTNTFILACLPVHFICPWNISPVLEDNFGLNCLEFCHRSKMKHWLTEGRGLAEDPKSQNNVRACGFTISNAHLNTLSCSFRQGKQTKRVNFPNQSCLSGITHFGVNSKLMSEDSLEC